MSRANEFISTLNVLSFYTKKRYTAVQLDKQTSHYFPSDHPTCVHITLKLFQRLANLQIKCRPILRYDLVIYHKLTHEEMK